MRHDEYVMHMGTGIWGIVLLLSHVSHGGGPVAVAQVGETFEKLFPGTRRVFRMARFRRGSRMVTLNGH